MPLPQLKPEILLIIFKKLHRPLPPVHSQVVDRSALRQPDLVSLLTVNKLFFNLTVIILYYTIVTDDLPQLLYPYVEAKYAECRRIPGIFSKAALLGVTRHLYVEYCHKEPDETPSIFGSVYAASDDDDYYPDEEHIRLWEGEMMAEAAERESWTTEILDELGPLHSAMECVTGWPKERAARGRPLFRNLATLSVGAVMGRDEEEAWISAGMASDLTESEPLYASLQSLFCQFVAETPTLQHVCLTPSRGPLSFGAEPYLRQHGASGPSISTHALIAGSPDHQPFAIGVPSSSYIHDGRWAVSSEESRDMSLAQVRAAMTQRDQLVDDRMLAAVPKWDIQATVYRSLPPREGLSLNYLEEMMFAVQPVPTSEEDRAPWSAESEALERAVAAEVAEVNKNRKPLPGGIEPDDKFIFRPLFEAKPCLACGWKYEPESENRD